MVLALQQDRGGRGVKVGVLAQKRVLQIGSETRITRSRSVSKGGW